MIMSRRSLAVFVGNPLVATLMAIGCAFLLWPLVTGLLKRRPVSG